MDWGFGPLLQNRIAQAGLASVAFNCSGSGIGEDLSTFSEEEAFAKDTYSRQLEDTARVREAILAGTFSKVDTRKGGLLGHSRGGGMGFVHAARANAKVPGDVAALVTWAAIEDADRFGDELKNEMRSKGHILIPNARTGQPHRIDRTALEDLEANRQALDILAACKQLSIPALVVHGTADFAVKVAAADKIHDALASSDKRKLIIEGAGHTFGAAHPFQESNAVLDQVIDTSVSFLAEQLLGSGN
ncbi:MAG: pimeloyl-ACP methyl ester carboxylesterase [Planctomycetota bacterium]|jgi:pimeloyl-ACP methyl ester carboxylesterase